MPMTSITQYVDLLSESFWHLYLRFTSSLDLAALLMLSGQRRIVGPMKLALVVVALLL